MISAIWSTHPLFALIYIVLGNPPTQMPCNKCFCLHCLISHHPIGTEHQDASCCLELESNWTHDWLSNAVVGRFAYGSYFIAVYLLEYRRDGDGYWRYFDPRASRTLSHTPPLSLSLRFYNLSWHTNFQQQTGGPPSGFQGSFFLGKENNKKAKPRSLFCSLSLCCKQLNEPTLDTWNPSKCVWGRIIVSREEKQTTQFLFSFVYSSFFPLCLAKNNKQASTANSVAHLSPSFSLCKVVQERNIGSRSKKKIGKGICTSQLRKKSWSYIAFSRFARPHLIPHFK